MITAFGNRKSTIAAKDFILYLPKQAFATVSIHVTMKDERLGKLWQNDFCESFNHFCFRSNELLPAFDQKYIKETDLKWSLKFDILSNFTDDQIPVS